MAVVTGDSDNVPIGTYSHYYDTWDRHQSMSVSSTKGLRNPPGENNCFLNCAVQVFWHLDVFRRSYRRLSGHSCMGDSCIFCALKVVFTQFQYSDKSSFQLNGLRKAMAEAFVDQQRFQLGHMDDAAECFENILLRIHYHIATNHHEDSCAIPHCLPHQKFAMAVLDQLECPCGAKSNPLTFHEMVHYISASALGSHSRMLREKGDVLLPDRFGLLLRNAGSVGDVRDCPSNCGKRVPLRRTLLNCPDVLSVGLVWDTDRPDGEQIVELMRSIGTTIQLQDVFHSVTIDDVSRLPKLHLVSMVCYYGKHYSTFVYHTKIHKWIYFDDAAVKEIGPRWENVVDKCCRGRYQPLLLLYTNLDAEPVCTDTAPKKTVMADGYISPGKGKVPEGGANHQRQTSSGIRRSLTPNQESQRNVDPAAKRVISPTSENKGDGEKELAKPLESNHRRQPSFLIAITGKNEKLKSSRDNSRLHPAVQEYFNREGRPMMGEYVAKNGQLRASFDTDSTDSPSPTEPRQKQSTDNPDCYTLSGSNQYRRPNVFSGGDQPAPGVNAKLGGGVVRKDSKKGKDKLCADVVRYHGDPNSSQPVNNDEQVFDSNKPKVPPKHFRTRSQSFEDSLCNHCEPGNNSQQFKIVKPEPAHNEGIERTHTPIQSGLATLPRKNHSDARHSRQNSQQQLSEQNHCPPRPNSSQSVPHTSYSNSEHFRQTSNSSHSQYLDISQQNNTVLNTVSSFPEQSEVRKSKEKPPLPERRTPSLTKRDSSEEPPIVDDKVVYINRKMVENILNHQKVSRQVSTMSSTSQNSNSSLESDSSVKKLVNKQAEKDNLSLDIPHDTISLDSQKDSGYASSDRNSSSSTGSITMDPYAQYFVSRSMIPPKTVNEKAVVEHMKMLMGHGNQHNNSFSSDSSYNDQKYYPSSQDTSYFDNKDPGYLSREEINNRIFKKIQEEKCVKQAETICQNVHQNNMKNLSLQQSCRDDYIPNGGHADKNTVESYRDGENDLIDFNSGIKLQNILPGYQEVLGGGDQFMSLCRRAEDLMDECMLVETRGDYQAALCYCDEALGYLKQAMKLQNLSQQSFVFVQKKHNSCVLKSRSLHKRLLNKDDGDSSCISSDTSNSVTSDKRSSLASSDSDSHGNDLLQFDNTQMQNKINAMYSQGSQNYYDPHCKSNVSSGNGQDNRTTKSVHNSQHVVHDRTRYRDNCVSQSVDAAHHPSRTMTNRPPNHNIHSTNQPNYHSRNSELHQANVNKKSVHTTLPQARTSSGSSTPTSNDGRYSDCSDHSTSSQQRYSKPEMGHVMPNRMLQRPSLPLHHTNSVLSVHESQSSISSNSSVGSVKAACITPTNEHVPNSLMTAIHPAAIKGANCVSENPAAWVVHNSHHPLPRCSSQPDCQKLGYSQNINQKENTNLSHPFPSGEPLARSSSSSQPDLRVVSPPGTDISEKDSQSNLSVRDLASRFENVIQIPGAQQTSSNDCSVSESRTTPTLHRQRSKSESSSSKPKSVLMKKKNVKKDRPRKTVTFCDNISSVADESSPVRNRQHFSDNELDDESSTSDDSPSEGGPGLKCNLCGKKIVNQGQFCEKCSYYMSRFRPTS